MTDPKKEPAIFARIYYMKKIIPRQMRLCYS